MIQPVKAIQKLLVGFQAFVWVLYTSEKHKRWLKKHLIPIIESFFEHDDGTLKEIGQKKILSYATLVPIFISHNTATLYGKKLSHIELSLQVYLAAITPLIDEFYETSKKDALQNLSNLLNSPNQYKPQNTHEELTLFLWKKILGLVKQPVVFHQTISQVIDIQTKSKLQHQSLSVSEIKQITLEKGGRSMLLFLVTLPFPVNPETERLFYNLGAAIQLLDDLLDIYEDSRAGIQTLATGQNIELAFREFRKAHQQVIEITKTQINSKSKSLFLAILAMLLLSGYVAIHNIQKLYSHSGHDFNPLNYSRSQLVTDMEKASNWWIAIRYYFQL
ncbi:MAG: hypothetical protein LC115_02980 [Bacteroidia bacterium]|nr:hypothetical protein [Bacteroidia bacterium]